MSLFGWKFFLILYKDDYWSKTVYRFLLKSRDRTETLSLYTLLIRMGNSNFSGSNRLPSSRFDLVITLRSSPGNFDMVDPFSPDRPLVSRRFLILCWSNLRRLDFILSWWTTVVSFRKTNKIKFWRFFKISFRPCHFHKEDFFLTIINTLL